MIIPQWGSLIAIQNAAKKYEDIVEVDAKKDDNGFTILKIVVKPQYNIDFVKDFLENHVPIGTGYDIIVDTSMDNKKNTNEDTMTKTRKIDFETKDYDRVEMDLDDFVWLITNLYYMAQAVGCVPSMASIENADNVLKVIFENNLNTYVD